jgi:hypothetical protein
VPVIACNCACTGCPPCLNFTLSDEGGPVATYSFALQSDGSYLATAGGGSLIYSAGEWTIYDVTEDNSYSFETGGCPSTNVSDWTQNTGSLSLTAITTTCATYRQARICCGGSAGALVDFWLPSTSVSFTAVYTVNNIPGGGAYASTSPILSCYIFLSSDPPSSTPGTIGSDYTAETANCSSESNSGLCGQILPDISSYNINFNAGLCLTTTYMTGNAQPANFSVSVQPVFSSMPVPPGTDPIQTTYSYQNQLYSGSSTVNNDFGSGGTSSLWWDQTACLWRGSTVSGSPPGLFIVATLTQAIPNIDPTSGGGVFNVSYAVSEIGYTPTCDFPTTTCVVS